MPDQLVVDGLVELAVLLRVLDASDEASELRRHGHEVSELSPECWLNKVGPDHLAVLQLDRHLLAALGCHFD